MEFYTWSEIDFNLHYYTEENVSKWVLNSKYGEDWWSVSMDRSRYKGTKILIGT